MVRFSVLIVQCCLVMLVSTAVRCQNYPNKPIRIVTGSTPQEYIARLIADGITGPLGQPVIVVNRPSVVIASETVAKSQADGHTVLLSASTFYVSPLTQKMPYDPVQDFAPLTIVGTAPLVVFLTASLPAKSVKELIAYAKSRPGELNYSIGGLGGAGHLAAELFNSMAGIKMVPVPYASRAQDMTDLIAGRVQLTIAPPSPLMEQVKAGKLKAVGVTSAEPSAFAPDIPPVAATLPGYEWLNMTVMLAPAKTPAPVINRLHQEITRVVKNADMNPKLLAAGVEVVGNSPIQFSAILKAEIAKISKLIKDIGLTVN